MRLIAEAARSGSARTERIIEWNQFDPMAEADWRGLVRDITAIANSGGGRIAVNAQLDERGILERLARHTDSAFDNVEVRPGRNASDLSVTIVVGATALPLHFSADSVAATTEPAPGFYFFHDGRSEQGTTADMREFVEALLRRVRRRWLRRIKRVLSAPLDATPRSAAAKAARRGRALLQPVRIVTDPEAPALQPQDVDRLYPWRQKDLLRELNRRLGRRVLNSYDIQAVRRHHRLDERPDFVFNLPGAGRRYSPAVADWIMAQYGADHEFFHNARLADQIAMKLRRQKPR